MPLDFLLGCCFSGYSGAVSVDILLLSYKQDYVMEPMGHVSAGRTTGFLSRTTDGPALPTDPKMTLYPVLHGTLPIWRHSVLFLLFVFVLHPMMHRDNCLGNHKNSGDQTKFPSCKADAPSIPLNHPLPQHSPF